MPGKRSRTVVAASILAALGTAGPSTAQRVGAQTSPLDSTSARLLALHNAARAAVGVPLLRWDRALQASATAYAAHLARTGRLVHAPRSGRTIERENLSQGLVGWSSDRMAASWLRERSSFVPGTFPNVSRTGSWTDVGHYSQIIWPTTTHVGCGLATGSGHQWLVCRYSPGGNKDGHRVGLRPAG